MIFSFGNLLSIFVVLIILIIYRQMDRNNRSLEKVKKYSDRIKADLGALVDQKTAEMKTLAIELDVNLKTGKEVLKRVRESEEALGQRAKGIEQVRTRLDTYDRALEELVDMTARVEENLKRVHSESAFVDKVGRRITSTAERLESIEQSVGKVEERFRSENQKALVALRDQIVQDTEDKVSTLAGVVTGSEQRIKDFGTYVTRLEARGEQLEREVLGRLNKGSEQLEADAKARRATVLNQFVASLNRLLADADAKSKQVRKGFEQSVAQAEERYAEQEKRLAEVVKHGEAMESKVFSGLKELIAKDSEAVRRSREELHKKLEESRAVRAELAGQVQVLQKELAGQIQALQRQHAGQTQALKEELAGQTQALQEELAGQMETLEKGLAGQVQSLQQDVTGQVQSLQQDVDRVRQDSLQSVEKAAEQMEVAALAQTESRLQDLEKQIAYRFEKLEGAGGDIEAMEKNLRQLADRTAATVREEFAEFTRGFEADRAAERTRVEEEFGTIRDSMKALEEELTGLKARAYENVSAQLQVFEDEFFKDLRKRNHAIEEGLKEWQTELEDKMEQVSASEVQARAGLEKRFTQDIEKRLEALRSASFEQLNVLGARVAAFETTLGERLGDSEKRVEELTRAVSTEIERGRQELDAAYQKQLSLLKDGVSERIQQITREADERLKGIETSLGTNREDIMNVSERVTELQRDLVSRSEFALEDFQKKVDNFEQEFSRRSKDLQAELAARSQEFRASFGEMKDKSEATHAGLSAKIEEGGKILNLTLTDLDKRVKNFVNQTKVFERADDLKVALEGRIEEMKRDMERLQAQRKEMEALETRIAGMRKSVDDVGGKLGKLLSERARVDGMDSDFKKLLSISKDLDERIENVYSSQDALQQIQAKIRKLEELEKATESRFDRLEKKKSIVEATTAGVDKNFEQLGALEKSIGGIRQELDTALGQLEGLKSHVEVLAGNRDKTEYVAEKIQELDGILGDLEQRMAKLDTAREWLAKTETRFESIGRQAQEQVRLMESILKADGKQAKLGEGAPPMDKRETVTKLAHLGWSAVEIARTTKLSRGEVELILELAPKK